jgi:hypothetical protein
MKKLFLIILSIIFVMSCVSTPPKSAPIDKIPNQDPQWTPKNSWLYISGPLKIELGQTVELEAHLFSFDVLKSLPKFKPVWFTNSDAVTIKPAKGKIVKVTLNSLTNTKKVYTLKQTRKITLANIVRVTVRFGHYYAHHYLMIENNAW